MAEPATLKRFFDASGIPVVLPAEKEYSSLSAYYHLSDPKIPLALVRPRNANEIAVAIKYAAQHRVEVIVRSGGGDLFGRSQAAGALVIDVRQMCRVEVATDRKTARVEGGCNVGQVAGALAQNGLASSCPPIPAVGYVGWSTLGGYGPFAPHFGLGVDQIVAAKLVNYKGDIIDADQELLKGLRGGGGNFGVIVELTIKVYPLKKMLAGMVVFDSSDIKSEIQFYARSCNKLQQQGIPDELALQPAVVNTDGGLLFGTIFVWISDDHALGEQWLEKVAALGHEQMRDIKSMTVREWQAGLEKLVPYGTYGAATSVSVKSITEQIAQVVGKHLAQLPSDKATSFSWHELRGKSAIPNPNSIFLAREPHYVLEILAPVAIESNVEESQTWAHNLREELLRCEGVLPLNYISLTNPAHTSLERLYGTNLEELRRLKRKYDPEGMFNLAVPRLV